MRSAPATAPSLAWQPSLLGDGPPTPDRTFATMRRIELSSGAWVDVAPGWLAGADRAFEQLVDAVPWRARQVEMYERTVDEPRLTCWWGEDQGGSWPDLARPMADALTARYGIAFDSLGANLYRDGSDSVAWHGDRVLREQLLAMVAVVSLGATRRFLLRPKGGGTSVRLDPAPGDLLVMGGTCQRTWQHSVPKVASAVGPRLSLMFRHRAPLRR
ncbi:MAG: alpha-ketoglutarate-dependent dioxygenase AlkB [Acidimicrobiales bacterium]